MKICYPLNVSALLLFALLGVVSSSKILFLMGLSSHSHRVAIQPLITKLADRGHDVTVFSPLKPEIPNPKVKEFCTKELEAANAQQAEDTTSAAALGILKDRHFDPYFDGNNLWDLLLALAEVTLRSSEFIDWIQNSKFDLIVYDYAGKEYIYPIAHRFKSKVIVFMSSGLHCPMNVDEWGLPIESWFEGMVINKYWWLPDFAYNAIAPLWWYSSFLHYYLPKIEAVAREALPFDFPPLAELIKTFDLVLLNDHFSSSYAFALPPYVIPVGGMHIKESNGTLPKDLEDFIKNVDQVVFISFGSIIRVSKLPAETQQIMFDAVASFKNTRFLWKWEGEQPRNLPKNVLVKQWFPQQDVLAHPKCKGFITQGGRMSFQQAMFHKVPVVVMPGFTDQGINAKTAAKLGVGIHLDLVDLTRETLSEAIDQILNNPKYSATVKEVSRRFQDRPLSAVDTAVWWTEYVLRHDTAHLKSDGFRQNWWQKRSLDFWFLVFSFVAVILTVAKIIIIFCAKVLMGKILSTAKVKQS